jgi:hypothetical protein
MNIVFPPCKHCGASHKLFLEDRIAGTMEPLDICMDCLMIGTCIPLDTHITLDEAVDVTDYRRALLEAQTMLLGS